MTKIAIGGLAALAILALGACTHDEGLVERLEPVEVRHPILVEPHFRELQVLSGAHGLSNQDRAGIRAAAREYLSGGHGKITVASPDGAANKRLAVSAVSEAVAVIENAGVPRNRIVVSSYAGDLGGAAVVISYIMYIASAPDCGKFGANIGVSPENMRSPNFGCATQNNLASMVEDPRDLIAPRGEDPASSARRTTVMKAYRDGQVTSSARNDQDSGAVSTVGR